MLEGCIPAGTTADTAELSLMKMERGSDDGEHVEDLAGYWLQAYNLKFLCCTAYMNAKGAIERAAMLIRCFWLCQVGHVQGVSCRQQGVLLVSGRKSMGALPAHLREWGRVCTFIPLCKRDWFMLA